MSKKFEYISTFPISIHHYSIHSILIRIHFILTSTYVYFNIWVFFPTIFRQGFSSVFPNSLLFFFFLTFRFNQIFFISWKNSWKHIYNWGNFLLILVFCVSTCLLHPYCPLVNLTIFPSLQYSNAHFLNKSSRKKKENEKTRINKKLLDQ